MVPLRAMHLWIQAPKWHQFAEEVSVALEGHQIMIRTIPPDIGCVKLVV